MNRSKMTWPDGYYVSYSYDAMSRMTTQTDSDGVALATRLYENVGRPAVLQYPFANDNVSYSWSPQDELILLTHNLALAANDVTFTNSFTPAHQIKGAAISNAAFKYSPPSSGTDVYPAVNGLNQYVSVTPSGGSAQTISYDTRGNLACAGTGCPTSTPSANAWVYTYDPENRMMTAGNGTVAAAFAYDPLGRRTQKSGTGVTTTTFVHDGDNEIAEYDGSGNLLRRFVPGAAKADGMLVGERSCTGTAPCAGSAATWQYFVADHLGSVATDGTSGSPTYGQVTCRVAFDPWVRRRNLDGTDDPTGSLGLSDPTMRGFTGHETIPSLCLVNMNARLQHPTACSRSHTHKGDSPFCRTVIQTCQVGRFGWLVSI